MGEYPELSARTEKIGDKWYSEPVSKMGERNYRYVVFTETASRLCYQVPRGGIPSQLMTTAIIQLAPCALENLRQSMNPRYKCIQDLLSQAFWAIMQISQYVPTCSAVREKQCSNFIDRNVNRDMTHGHASSYISGLMQPAYARMNQEGGMSI